MSVDRAATVWEGAWAQKHMAKQKSDLKLWCSGGIQSVKATQLTLHFLEKIILKI